MRFVVHAAGGVVGTRLGTIEAGHLNGETVLPGREHGVTASAGEPPRRLAGRMAREGLPPGLTGPEEFPAAPEGPVP